MHENNMNLTAKSQEDVSGHLSNLSSSKGRLEQAKRFALMNYDHWNEVTEFPSPHTSYYYEIASIIEDAVEFGFGVAHGQSWKTIVKRIKRAGK